MRFHIPFVSLILLCLLGCFSPGCDPDNNGPSPQPDQCARGQTQCEFGDLFTCAEICQDFQGGSGCHFDWEFTGPCPRDAGTDDTGSQDLSSTDAGEEPDAESCTDFYEPNDSKNVARSVLPGGTYDAIVCAGDIDVFSVALTSGTTLTIAAEFQFASGRIVLFDSDMADLLDPNNALTGSLEQIETEKSFVYGVPADGDYFLLVYDLDSVENSYELSVTIE